MRSGIEGLLSGIEFSISMKLLVRCLKLLHTLFFVYFCSFLRRLPPFARVIVASLRAERYTLVLNNVETHAIPFQGFMDFTPEALIFIIVILLIIEFNSIFVSLIRSYFSFI